jgi:uncharacterized peroxidase-related enzyme
MPDDANVRTIFAMAEERFHGWHDLSEHLMRAESPFSLEERELIAGYVSGVNACQFCHGVHSQVAIALGFAEDGFVKLMEDVDTSDVDEKMKPVLKYVRKLTVNPSKMLQADADAVFEAGMFNFMNRMLEGHGIKGDPATFAERGRMKAKIGYADRSPLNADGKPEPAPAK